MKHSLSFLVLIVAFFSLVQASHPLQADAALTLSTKKVDYFGGSIKKVVYCTCVYYPGEVLTVADKATNSDVHVMYNFWISKLYANYNIWEDGPNVIGGFQKGGTCLNQKAYYCTQNEDAKDIDGTIDWIRGIGSSGQGGGFGGLSI